MYIHKRNLSGPHGIEADRIKAAEEAALCRKVSGGLWSPPVSATRISFTVTICRVIQIMTQVHQTLEISSSESSASKPSVEVGENGVCVDLLQHPQEMDDREPASPANVDEPDRARKV